MKLRNTRMGNKAIDLVSAPQQTSTCVYYTASISLAAAHPCPVRYSCMFGLAMKSAAYKTGECFLIADSTHSYQKPGFIYAWTINS